MFFAKYKIYENKLSEQVSDNNPLKQKLIDMETPTEKSPIYSFISIFMLVYIWLFQIMLIYTQSYGYQYSLLSVIFTTICFLITYRKAYLANNNIKYIRIGQVIFVISLILSFYISSTDSSTLSFKNILSTFVFFVGINNKSYLALSTLSFLTLGIVISYFRCSYEMYRSFYSETKRSDHKTFEQVLRICVIMSFVMLLILPHAINLTFNPCKDSFDFMLKMFSFAFFSMLPPWLTRIFQTKKYLNAFDGAQLTDIKQTL